MDVELCGTRRFPILLMVPALKGLNFQGSLVKGAIANDKDCVQFLFNQVVRG